MMFWSRVEKDCPGDDDDAIVSSSAKAEALFSGTSILSPSRSQKSGAGLASEQSTPHSRACPLGESWRVTLTWRRSEEVSTNLDWRRTGLSQKGVWAKIVGSCRACCRRASCRAC